MIDGHDLLESLITVVLDSTSLVRLHLGLISFLSHENDLSIDFNLLCLDLFLSDNSLFSLQFELRDEQSELFLDGCSLITSLGHLLQTTAVLLNIRVVLTTLVLKQRSEGLDQDEIRCWRNVVVPSQLEEVALGELAHTLLHVNTDSNNTILLWQVINLGQEELSHIFKGICGPWHKPVNCATVDKGREHT